MITLLLELVLFAAPAFAGVVCESVGAVEGKISACSENLKAVESAKVCYDKIIHEWNTVPVGLRKVMSISKERAQSRQEAEFQFTHSDYEKTRDKLKELIAMTDRNTELLTKYSTAMLRDFDIEAASGVALPCYADNFAKLKEIVWALDDRIAEGEATLEKTEQLRGLAVGRDTGLDTADTNGLVRGGVNVGSGAFTNGKSDVTGVREDRAKRSGQKGILAEQSKHAAQEFTKWEIWREKEAEKLNSYLASPERRAAQAARNSVISKSEALEVFSDTGAVSRDFGAEISSIHEGADPGKRQIASVANEMAQREAHSVGAFLFREGGSGQSSVKLELREESSAPSDMKPVAVLAEAEAPVTEGNSYELADLSSAGGSPGSDGGKLAGVMGSLRRELPKPADAQVGNAVRGADESLFSAVSERYRRTELFRRARVTHAPLELF